MNQTNPLDVLTKKNLLIYTGSLGVLLIAATVIFGLHVLLLALVSYAVGLIIEWLFAHFRKKPFDPSWMVTPLVITLLLPPTAPLWLAGIASGFGVMFGKAIFGGLGKNVFNPALVGILFVWISFPVEMATTWLNPINGDIIASATPLMQFNGGVLIYSLEQLLFGNVPGTLGETFRLGIIVLGLLLVVLKVSDWRIPLAFLSTVLVLTFLVTLIQSKPVVDPLYSLFVGGVLFGAFFVATDPATSPRTDYGKFIFGIGAGFLTVLIRHFAAAPEGVLFAIILMNALAPLIDSNLLERAEKKRQALGQDQQKVEEA